MTQSKETYDEKLKEIQELEAMLRMKEGLPHLYSFPFYEWTRRIFESTRQEIMLTAANQIGKSSCAIRKNIELCTNPSLWPIHWPHLRPGQIPSPFWYMYPTLQVASESVSEKWIKEFLPRGEYKEHPQYGWKEEWHKGEIYAIHFNTGVSIIFKSMSQKVADLQTSSVWHLTCDEELDVKLLPELTARTFSTSGKMLFVFTATKGQDHWRRAMEPATPEEETHKDALKLQVSLYDCKTYEDGSASPWTAKKIARVVSNCTSEREVARRVYGKFVMAEGLVYQNFTLEKNISEPHPLPKDWSIFVGVDPGAGGTSHPTAICFLAVAPDGRSARVFRGWRGDGIPTTSEDILDKFRELRGELQPQAQVYDFSAKDFFMIASRAGESFQPADKARDRGIGLLNTLFKSGVLRIQRGDPELDKLINELCSLSSTTKKTVAKDDFIDALRYAAMSAMSLWDFPAMEEANGEKIFRNKPKPKPRPLTDKELRREWRLGKGEKTEDTIEDEFKFWSDLL